MKRQKGSENKMLPSIVTCNERGGSERRKCGSTALYESENILASHAYYRCQKPECRALVVVCFNEEHTQ